MLIADDFGRLFHNWLSMVIEQKERLVDLDSVGGDGDLGIAMVDGFTSIEKAISSFKENDIGKLLYLAGKAMGDNASSSLGTLLAFGFMGAAKVFKGKTEIENKQLVDFFEAFENAIVERGGAKLGEKTFLDAFDPAVSVLKDEDFSGDLFGPLRAAAYAAHEGALSTKDMIARHGRIAVRGEKSVGIIDPGAVVAALLVNTMAETFGGNK